MCSDCGQGEEYHTIVTIYKVGPTQEYRIPNFPVVTVQLREIIYHFEFIGDDCSTTMMYTGYIRDSLMMNRPFPALAKVCCVSSDVCYVEKAEFNKVINIEKKNLWQDKVLVVWNWNWVLPTGSDDDSIGSQLSDGEDSNSSDGNDTQKSSSTQYTHRVIFKCIGATKEKVLAEVASRLRKGEVVKVMLRPEPSNPKDSRAIAFDCNIGTKWERIGYIVQEALSAVHSAIKNNLIVSVNFEWVKYITHWSRSAPGWYSGIAITKQGDWPVEVVRCASRL